MKQLVLALLAFLSFGTALSAQDETLRPQVFSPNAAGLGEYGKVPVSYFSGLPNIEIPLATLKAKGHNLDFALSYHGGGIRPDIHPGWTGIGWVLQGGGSITRIINGKKDELDGGEYGHDGLKLGYVYNCAALQSYNPTNENQMRYLCLYCQNLDLEPDEFQINAPGINASFYIAGFNSSNGSCDIRIKSKAGGSFRVDSLGITSPYLKKKTLFSKISSPQGPILEVSATQYAYISFIQITDDKGTIYRFGGSDDAIEFSYDAHPKYADTERAEWNVIGTANSWVLREIEYSNGETVTFEYKKDGMPIVVRDSHYRLMRGQHLASPEFSFNSRATSNYPRYPNLNFSYITPCYLTLARSSVMQDSLSFSSGKSHELGYGYTEEEFSWRVVNCAESDTLGGNWTYAELKAPDYYLKLDSISTPTRTIRFHHRDISSARLRLDSLTFSTPLGERINSYSMQYDPTSLPGYNAKQTDHWGYYNGKYYGNTPFENLGTFRTASLSLCKAESLVRLTYPTGGWSDFEWELNEWSRVADPLSEDGYIKEESGAGGGLRIKTISNYDGAKTNRRRFTYTSSGNSSSGVHGGVPCYCIVGNSIAPTYKSWQWISRSLSIDESAPYYMAAEYSLAQLSLTDGRVVTYDSVRETFDDGTSVEYNYTNHGYSPDHAEEGNYTNIDNMTLVNRVTSGELGRGLLSEMTWYGASGTATKKEAYTYWSYNLNYLKGFAASAIFPGGTLYRLSSYKVYTSYPGLMIKSVTEYSPTGQIGAEQHILYEYNPNRLLSRESVSLHDGSKLRRSIIYAADREDAVGTSMADRNMLSFPFSVINSRLMLSGRNRLVSGTRSVYSRNPLNGDYVITEIDKALGDSCFSSIENYPWLRMETISKYDNHSNPRLIIKRDSSYTTYSWDNAGRYPIKEVRYTTGAPGNADADSLVRSFTWLHHVGIASITDERGRTENYSYDDFGRLSGVADHEGNPLKSFTYAYASTTTQNRIEDRTFTSATGGSSYFRTSFFDGLGLEMESLLSEWSPLGSGYDIVTMAGKDVHGRDSVSWLPVCYSQPYGISGDFADRFDIEEIATIFDLNPYTFNRYTADGRKLSVTGPGQRWHGAGKARKTSYFKARSGNNDSLGINIYRVSWTSDTVACISLEPDLLQYDFSKISVIRTEDEDGGVTFHFYDAEGRLMLHRKKSGNTKLDTYYLYDIHGNLEFIMPPAMSWYGPNFSQQTTTTIGNLYAWQYRYDDEGKLIAEKAPGSAWKYYLYDAAGRAILSQNGREREEGRWHFLVQDAIGRNCVEGLCSSPGINPFSASYASIPRVVKPTKVFPIQTPGSGETIIPPSLRGYALNQLSLSNTVVLSAWYWDNYSFPADYQHGNLPDSTMLSSGTIQSASGLLTGTYLTFIEGDMVSDGMAGVYSYDTKGRVSEYVERDTGDYHKRELFTYSFTDNLLSSETRTTISQGDTLIDVRTFSYDNAGRLLSESSSVNGSTPVFIAQNSYDAIGRLSSERHGGPYGPLCSYTYNLRSEIRGITSQDFTEVYSSEEDIYLPSYTGNIVASASDDGLWEYTYDKFSRLIQADLSDPDSGDSIASYYYGYDSNSNMSEVDYFSDNQNTTLTLERDGNVPSEINGDYIPSVHVMYWASLWPDANGNISIDDGSRLEAVEYNIIDKMSLISAGDYGGYEYTYLSDGSRWSMYDMDTGITTIWSGNATIPTSGTKRVFCPYGYADLSAAGQPAWRFFIKDRRGNVRRVVDGNGTVLQRLEYTPYGTPLVCTGSNQTIRFSGNELIPNQYGVLYDFGARVYAPWFSMFFSPDPLAHRHYDISPYSYCAGNPIRYVDPDGNDWYEDENGNAMWRNSSDKVYLDNNNTIWNNIGSEYLWFNGESLVYYYQNKDNNIDAISFNAVSGRPKNKVFDYSKNSQAVKNGGPIPEGLYYVSPSDIQYYSQLALYQKVLSIFRLGPFPGGRIAWGNCRVWISPSSVIVQNPETDETVIRSNLSIHGGTVPGSAGCIDLTNNADSFFNLLVHSNSDRIRLNVYYSRPGFR